MTLPFPFLILWLLFLAGFLIGVYAVLLWTKLNRLEQKLDQLVVNCRRHHEEAQTRYLTRLEHEVEHQGLWEALHHHEHDFRGRMRR